jgi:hypothetical protein
LIVIENPEVIYEGKAREYLAVKRIDGVKMLVAVYSEFAENDGFVITAFITSKVQKLEKMNKIWTL